MGEAMCGSVCYPTSAAGGSYVCSRPFAHGGRHHSDYGETATWDDEQVWIGSLPPAACPPPEEEK